MIDRRDVLSGKKDVYCVNIKFFLLKKQITRRVF